MFINRFATAAGAAVTALWAEPADYSSPLTGHQQGFPPPDKP
jgi:hypothetical protein